MLLLLCRGNGSHHTGPGRGLIIIGPGLPGSGLLCRLKTAVEPAWLSCLGSGLRCLGSGLSSLGSGSEGRLAARLTGRLHTRTVERLLCRLLRLLIDRLAYRLADGLACRLIGSPGWVGAGPSKISAVVTVVTIIIVVIIPVGVHPSIGIHRSIRIRLLGLYTPGYRLGLIIGRPVIIVVSGVHGPYVLKGLYPCRSGARQGAAIAAGCRLNSSDAGPVDGKTVIRRPFSRGSAGTDRHGPDCGAGIPGHFIWVGAAGIIDSPVVIIRHIVVGDIGIPDIVIRDVRVIIIDNRIVDHRGVIDDRHIPLLIDIVVIDMGAGDVLIRDEAPVMGRGIIASANGNADADIRSQGGPSIIIRAPSPAHPCRGPFMSGYPHPSIAVPEKPAAVMESGPSPLVVGSPCPSFLRIYPMPVGGIRLEIGACTRHPYVTVIRIIDPLAVRGQLVIERLIGNFRGRRRGWRWRRVLDRGRVLMENISGAASI